MICLACRRGCECRPLPKLPKVTGAQVRAFRASIGWTQPQLAAALQVTRVTISRWESESHEPSGDSLLRLHAVVAQHGARLVSR